jgi:membrane-bound lytic murein transglycosylase F
LLQELRNHFRHLHFGVALILSLVLIGAALITFGASARMLSLTATAALTPPAGLHFSPTAPGAEELSAALPATLPEPESVVPPENALRILAVRDSSAGNRPAVSRVEQQLLEDFAISQGLEPLWLLRDYPSDLPAALLNGEGDLIAGAEPAMLARFNDEFEYTMPWRVSRQVIVMRKDGERIEQPSDLSQRQIVVSRDSPAWPKLLELAAEHPGMELIPAPDDLPKAMILKMVALGQYDLAVADSEFLGEFLPGRHDLSVAYELPGGKSHAWLLRRDDDPLQDAINKFLSRETLTRSMMEVRFEDLPQIIQRRELRVITYRSPGNFYLDDSGELRGFEYELVRKFARDHGLRVEMVVAPSQQEMLRWLLEGRGDLIAASMPISGLRPDPRLSMSRPYNYAAPLIVGRDGEQVLIDARDLDGRRVVLPVGSPHSRMLKRLRQGGIRVDIVEAEDNQTLEQVLSRVEMGHYDLTMVDSHKAKTLLALQDGLQVHFPLSEPEPHVWVMRTSDQKLQQATNQFIDAIYRSADYNTLHARYFAGPRKFTPLTKATSELLALGGELSPYDELVRQSADKYGFDWRLIVAQMYQESRFDPRAESTAGAMGLMQILPTTADEIGLTELTSPRASIHAGVGYLHTLFDRFDNDLAYEDRLWFSLAAYNAGFGRVQQARRLAESMGLDPDRWFGHVEQAMLSLAGTTACRCGQPVHYVREIRTRYHNYVRLTEATQYALGEPARINRDS